MRSTLPQWARLVAFALFGAACGPKAIQTGHGRAPVTVKATCSGNQVTLAVNPSTVQFRRTGVGQPPTDVNWTLDPSSNVDDVGMTPDAEWPLEAPSPPPFHARRGAPYLGVGKPTQTTAHYRYSVTVICPNGGPTAIFDPDIWVD